MSDVVNTQQSYTVYNLVDLATQRQSRWRQRGINRRRRRMGEQAFFDALAEHATSRLSSVALQADSAFSDADDISQVSISLTPGDLEEWLRVISDFLINVLPKIIEVLLPIFTSIALVACLVLLPSSAAAQDVVMQINCSGPAVQSNRSCGGALAARLVSRRRPVRAAATAMADNVRSRRFSRLVTRHARISSRAACGG